MSRRTLKLLAYSPWILPAGIAFALIVQVFAAVPYSIAIIPYTVLASVVGAVVCYYVQHAIRRGPGTLGRRLGWVAYIVLLPMLGMPSYYEEVISRISDNQEIEVVVSSRDADRDSGSIAL